MQRGRDREDLPQRNTGGAMADNSAKIAEIRAKIQRGMTSFATDGQSGSYDLDALKAELRRLEADDNTARKKKPIITKIRLGGFQ